MKALVIGLGSIGTRHANNLVELGVEVIGIEPNKEMQTLHMDYVNSIADAEADIAVICSPTDMHIKQAIECAKKGMHLFIEKPPSDSLDGIDELKKICKEKKLVAMVACNFRFSDGLKLIKKLADEKKYGSILGMKPYFGQYLPSMRKGRDYKTLYAAGKSGGVILDSFHEFDYALWFLGLPVDVHFIRAKVSKLEIEKEDIAEVTMSYKNAIANIHVDYLRMKYKRSCEFIFEDATAVWDYRADENKETVELYQKDGKKEMLLDAKRKEKLSLYCNVPKENIISDPDLAFVYEMPVIFEQQLLGQKLVNALKIPVSTVNWNSYDSYLQKLNTAVERIPIAYIGKYVAEGKGIHKDAYISVEEALTRACIEMGFLPEIHRIDAVTIQKDQSVLKKMAGIIVPGGYGARGLEGKIAAIKYARENGVPFLGLCLGLQMGVVEFARNVCSIANAHSEEMDEERDCPDRNAHVICRLPEQEKLRQTQGFIGTQRLGDFACIIDKSSFVHALYEKVGRPDEYEKSKLQTYDKLRLGQIAPNDFVVMERHRHRYEVNPSFHRALQEKGMLFPGVHYSADGTMLVEIISWKDHPFSVATQAHPEFTSNYKHPNPLFLGFAEAVKGVKLDLPDPPFVFQKIETK